LSSSIFQANEANSDGIRVLTVSDGLQVQTSLKIEIKKGTVNPK
jgi:hypothetical protein